MRDLGSTWCPECHAHRLIEDIFTAGYMERWGEQEYRVTALECGHEIQGEPHTIAAAPGAPYAGPDVATAHSHRPRDLWAARQRQRQLDVDPFAAEGE